MSASNTTTRSRPPAKPAPAPAPVVPRPGLSALVAVAAVVAVVVGLLLPDRTVGGDMSGMSMTHYMGLLAINQPWNLLLFMAIPVILAETLAITELVLLFRKDAPAWVAGLSRIAGLIAGPLMLGILVHLLRYAAIPLTTSGGWRGTADVIAVLSYLAGAVPLVGITLVELGIVGGDAREARKWHVIFVGAFLVIAHVAMIFGMLDPTVLGWDPSHVMPQGTIMPGMQH
ncbi:DUF6803 family protein [Intrasporangium sp. DVR]|uniref:DUF6803 family protein n=1 Tax=Intrasporangium sp. DVR TaxID=3127867 RepID=UPI00313A5848